MSEPKPFASLSPSLLARKGAARPAMRPQIQPIQQFHEATARQMHEDLGWNDMGHDLPDPRHEPVAEEAPREAQVVSINGSDLAEPVAAAQPPAVGRQQEDIVRSLTPSRPAPAVVAAPVEVPTPAVAAARAPASEPQSRRSALADGRRAAFTLRLDAQRHLQLRLACTLNNRSAQQIVTEALDRLLADMPEIAALASKVRKRG